MGAQMSQLKPSQMTLPTKDGSSMKQVKHRTSLEEFILNCELNEVSPVRGKKNNQKSARIDSKMIPAVDRTEDEEEQDESFIHMGRQNLNSLNKIKKKISGANHKKIQVLSLLKQKNYSSGLEDYKESIRHEDMRIIIDGNKNQSHFCIKTCRELGKFISESSILRNEKQTNLMDYSHKSKKLYTINRR